MRFAIEGFLQDHLVDLGAQSAATLRKLKATPSSALGSSRHKLKEDELPRILDLLKKHDIRYFFLIGGNDTMDTIHRVEAHCRREGYELRGVGIPKTVDNDLYGTDHTPGYGSAATYVARSVAQAGLLARDMQKVDKFVVFQTVGRDAGWLAAAAALAKKDESEAPHLIYMPEKPFDRERCLADVENCISRYGFCSIVCGEGTKYADGTPVSATTVQDGFANVEFGAMGGGSAAMRIHRMISDALKVRGEFQVPESLQMCASDRVSPLDVAEAYACGREAVRLAVKGTTGVMVALVRPAGKYRTKLGTAPLSEVADAGQADAAGFHERAKATSRRRPFSTTRARSSATWATSQRFNGPRKRENAKEEILMTDLPKRFSRFRVFFVKSEEGAADESRE